MKRDKRAWAGVLAAATLWLVSVCAGSNDLTAAVEAVRQSELVRRLVQWELGSLFRPTDTMGLPALLARFGRTPKADLHETLLTMGMEDGAQYLIREYALPLDRNGYLDVMREVIAQLYEKVELKPGVQDTLARLRAEGARMCVCSNTWSSQCRTVLTRLGVDEYFDFYIEARGAMSKSSPAPFMEALHRLGGTEPAGCAVCEDALYAAQTAHDAGFYLVGIQDTTSAADAPALRRICDQFLPDWTALDWAQV